MDQFKNKRKEIEKKKTIHIWFGNDMWWNWMKKKIKASNASHIAFYSIFPRIFQMNKNVTFY